MQFNVENKEFIQHLLLAINEVNKIPSNERKTNLTNEELLAEMSHILNQELSNDGFLAEDDFHFSDFYANILMKRLFPQFPNASFFINYFTNGKIKDLSVFERTIFSTQFGRLLAVCEINIGAIRFDQWNLDEKIDCPCHDGINKSEIHRFDVDPYNFSEYKNIAFINPLTGKQYLVKSKEPINDISTALSILGKTINRLEEPPYPCYLTLLGFTDNGYIIAIFEEELPGEILEYGIEEFIRRIFCVDSLPQRLKFIPLGCTLTPINRSVMDYDMFRYEIFRNRNSTPFAFENCIPYLAVSESELILRTRTFWQRLSD